MGAGFGSLADYTLDGIAGRINCPILLTDPENEQFWPRQSHRLYRAVSTPDEKKALVEFTGSAG